MTEHRLESRPSTLVWAAVSANNISSRKAFFCVKVFCNAARMLSKSGIIRWGAHLLCVWCLLATHGDLSSVPHSTHCSQSIELTAAIAPTAVDFSDTAQQSNCQCLVKADQQIEAYECSVGLLASIKLPLRSGLSATHDAQLPDAASLFALGIALRL